MMSTSLSDAGLGALRPADAVERLNVMALDTAAASIAALAPAEAVRILDMPGLERKARLFGLLDEPAAARLLAAMSADRRTDVFRKLDAQKSKALRCDLTPADRATLDWLLGFPANTAGAIMTTEFVTLDCTMTAAAALDAVRHANISAETIYALYLVDPGTRHLRGAMALRELIALAPDAHILDFAHRDPVRILADAGRMDVSRLISKYDLLSVPIVDAEGNLQGIVTVDDVIDAILDEDTEDAQKFGGMEALGQPYLRIGFLPMMKKRAGWLCALFLSEMLTASAMQYFQGELEKAVVLTLFIPLIMSSGGNSGSQATSLIIRALALHEIKLGQWWRVALREAPTGLALGAILGAIGVVRIVVWQKTGIYDYGEHWMLIALTVGAALVGIVTFGSLAGSMLPFVMQKIGFDPASASAPFVATLVDVTGLVIYFTIALAILKGTLL